MPTNKKVLIITRLNILAYWNGPQGFEDCLSSQTVPELCLHWLCANGCPDAAVLESGSLSAHDLELLMDILERGWHVRIIFLLFNGRESPHPECKVSAIKSKYPEKEWIEAAGKGAVLPRTAARNESVPQKSSMQTFRDSLELAAQTDDCVLILGESGSGKSWAAREIHKRSARKRRKMLQVSVTDFNQNLIESNLFGCTRGAYTGAMEQEGVFAQGDGTTIFLDEIAEVPNHVQSKLLKVVENRSYCKVGSLAERHFDSKLVFATNVNIEKSVEQGLFRKDLFYRINTVTIKVPPLREHKEDIPRLAREFASERGKELSAPALKKLLSYSWPGNIRELKNAVYKACILAGSRATVTDCDFEL